MNILLPTDFSEASQQALKYFENLSQNLDVQISVLNAYSASNSPSRPFIAEGSHRKQARKQVQKFVGKQLLTSGKKVRYKAREGFPVQTILEQSARYDLIVMSKNQSYAWAERWTGSRSYRVARQSHCPVLILPYAANFEDIKDIFPFGEVQGWQQHAVVQFLQGHWQARIHTLADESTSTKSTQVHEVKLTKFDELERFVQEAGIELLVLKLTNSWKESNPFVSLSNSRVIHNLQLPVLAFNTRNLAQ